MKAIADLLATPWPCGGNRGRACTWGLVIWRSHTEATKPVRDQVTVVSAPLKEVGHRLAPNDALSDAATMPPPGLLDTDGANQLVTRYLPELREVHSECDVEVCAISAEPSAAGQPLDDQAFSQLVRDDMPAILARAGHGLLEPIQIEELGPDQYRLRFRIPRQAH